MKINSVIDELCRQKAKCEYNRDFIIYMTRDYWAGCMTELYKMGGVTPGAHEFYQHNTINGYPVYTVIEENAPQFTVVMLGE